MESELDRRTGDTTYRFGAFELMVRRQLLMHLGTPIHIGSRALAILTLLLERAGELVAREELIAAAWPTTFVDVGNLKVNVANLRRVLTVCDPQQDFIATVPGRGYRFVGPVRRNSVPTITYSSANRCEPLPPPSSLVGRETEVAAVRNAILEAGFVTIAGAGGVGKSSVAIAAAHLLSHQFGDGARLVDLAPVGDPQFLASAIAAELGVRSNSDDLLGAAIHALKKQKVLLVFDNCEHLLPSIAAAAEKLASGIPNASFLVTSREPLRLPREDVYRLEPLAVPPAGTTAGDPAKALNYPAVELFVTRAAEASARELDEEDLEIVVEICRRLDGIPLAIELAASRTAVYAPAELLRLLCHRFDLFDQGSDKGPARHRTLRATLEWSYGLLSAQEATILRALSVYAGAFTINDAIVVASAAGVLPAAAFECTASLISKSLLAADWRENVLHYRLLDSTRSFAANQLLDDPNRDRIRQRYAEHVCVSLERAQVDWQHAAVGARVSEPACGLADVRRVLAWSFGRSGSVVLGIRLTVAAIPMWENLSLLDESIIHLSRALAEGREAGFDDPEVEVRLQIGLASALMYARGLAPETSIAWDLALGLADAAGGTECRLRALWGRAVCDLHLGQPAEAARQLRRFGELCRKLGDQSAAPDGERLLAAAEMYLGDLARARTRVEHLSAVYLKPGQRARHARFQVDRAAALGTTRAMLLWLTGHPDAAVRLAEDTARDAIASGHAVSICNALSLTACPIALWGGRLEDAERHLKVLQDQLNGARLTLWARLCRCLQGALAVLREEEEGIDLLERAVSDLVAPCSAIRAPAFLAILAEGMARKKRIGDALRTIEKALSLAETQRERWILPELLRVEAAIRVQHGQAGLARKLLLEAVQTAEEIGAVAWKDRADHDLSNLRRDAGKRESANQPSARIAVSVRGPRPLSGKAEGAAKPSRFSGTA